MKTLDLIRYITQHYNLFYLVDFYEDGSSFTTMEAINYLASIDPSNYDDIRWEINLTSKKYTLSVYKS
jgi:hypothetical protein